MDETCKVRNSIGDIKAKKDAYNDQAKDNKQLWDELESNNTIIIY